MSQYKIPKHIKQLSYIKILTYMYIKKIEEVKRWDRRVGNFWLKLLVRHHFCVAQSGYTY